LFSSGFIAERVNLRYFLALGMLLSGFFTYLFGLAYSRGIHNISYFIFAQVYVYKNAMIRTNIAATSIISALR
jgi:sugar phosphate permease